MICASTLEPDSVLCTQEAIGMLVRRQFQQLARCMIYCTCGCCGNSNTLYVYTYTVCRRIEGIECFMDPTERFIGHALSSIKHSTAHTIPSCSNKARQDITV